MWITRDDWSEAALQRAARDGAVVLLRPGMGVARDLDRTRGVRAAALSAAVPHGAALTGVSALWVAGWRGAGPAPSALTIAVARGAHPDRPPAYDGPWRYVTEEASVRRATARGDGSASVCVEPTDACVVALAYEQEPLALPAVHWALASGLVCGHGVRARIGSLGASAPRTRALRLFDLLAKALAA